MRVLSSIAVIALLSGCAVLEQAALDAGFGDGAGGVGEPPRVAALRGAMPPVKPAPPPRATAPARAPAPAPQPADKPSSPDKAGETDRRETDQGRQERAGRIDPGRVIGLSETETTHLMGLPRSIREEAPATVWAYANAGCRLDVFFYLELESRARRALAYELSSVDGTTPVAHACGEWLRVDAATAAGHIREGER